MNQQEINFIKEGSAIIKTKQTYEKDGKQIEEEVFYNPVQIFNRDFTIMAIDTFSQSKPPITILDALSASGLRSIRFSKEIKNVKEIYANDISLASLSMIKENIIANQVNNVITHHMDANKLMSSQEIKFDVIDLDPYGSVGPFLHSALLACNDSLLCITCTDSRVLCGPDYQKCFSQYGTSRVKMDCFAENGIRTLLYTIASEGAKVRRAIKPLLSLYGEFYLRVFVYVQRDKTACHKLISQVGNAFVCTTCQSFWNHPYGQKDGTTYKYNKSSFPSECKICKQNLRLNGPVWLQELNCIDFVNQMKINMSNHIELPSYQKVMGKIEGILNQAEFELYPYAYNFCQRASFLRSGNISKKEILQYMSFKLSAGIQSLGFQVSQGYLQKDEYKTNAPPEAIFDVIKKWKQIKTQDKYLLNVELNSPVHNILNSPLNYIADFNFQPKYQQAKMFYPNPEKNWGPKARAVQRKVIDTEDEIQKKSKIE